ncbi:GNAT family N-acetyltransferase [Paraburkholderia sp. JPY432]|uniref:GNAT family N-acetyltransferase n=1 Tax=Paraburkholderia youngii TaxID=2782701 RepID=UPI0015962F1F|nr:GNAT family N-acetyltransferase [Paraburkholderia youngii]NVH74250.1 GNAT family N-acetyltransferase [Paraburkholderia youngii]
MNDASAAYEIVTGEAGFLALRSEWNDLWARSRGWYFQSFSQCWLAWEQIAKPQGRKLRIIVRREAGRAVLIFPLIAYRRALWTYLAPLSSESADLTSVLVEDDARTAALVEGAWDAARKRCGADFIEMPYVPDSTDLHRLALEQRHFVVREQTPRYVARISVESQRYDWKGYCDSLGTFHRKKPGKIERRLASAGKVGIHVLDWTEKRRIATAVDAMLAWKRDWAVRAGKEGPWLHSEHYRNFLLAWLSTEGAAVKSRATVITVDDAAVAVVLVCADARAVTGIMSSYDPAFGKWSLGLLNVELTVMWAFDLQLDFECGPGSEEYKLYWSRENLTYCSTTLSINSPWGLVGVYARRWLRDLVKRARSSARAVEAPSADPAGQPQNSPGA